MNIKTLSKAFGFVFFVAVLTACEQPIAQNQASDEQNQACHIEGQYTTIEVDDYQIKIFNPNDLAKPDIWEGPICITNSKKNLGCSVDISLIKSVTVSQDKNILLVNQFTGSNESVVQILLENCELSIE